MDYKKLASLLFSHVTETPEETEARFPRRNLPEGAKVTRIAPSPTGFVHFGNLFPALVSERLAHQSGGIFLLRIEDTDEKRKVEGAVELILSAFRHYELGFDEGALANEEGFGNYGPYYQSLRAHVYHVFAKQLVEQGLAYPCFCTHEELEASHSAQEAAKVTPGYWGEWATCRDLSLEEIEEKLASGMSYTLRLKSPGKPGGRIRFTDTIKGDLELDENFTDAVLLKSDGIPTYHFAHAVDDHLMRVTHVVRGEEWLSTLPLHVQLFDLLGFRRPKYVHIAHLMKRTEDGGKRKLSKRHDPEAALSFYQESGYPVEGVREYVMSVLNSNFEEWRRANPALDMKEFPFSIKKMSASGALFDLNKLDDISKNILALRSAEEMYNDLLAWAKTYDAEFASRLEQDPAYAKAYLGIGRGGEKPRKDFARLSELPQAMAFFYDDLYKVEDELPENEAVRADAREILSRYSALYSADDDRDTWFDKIRTMGEEMGYAARPKDYKQNPDAFRGHVGDISAVLRLAVTGRKNSPDLYDVMQVLGYERVANRLNQDLF
ncbi:MAG: glutamate--tRNA ligase [Clostridia bacterium]|nr:glutamate--tRNA ligase [Clostridia bacterium]